MTIEAITPLGQDDSQRLAFLHSKSFDRPWTAQQFSDALALPTTLGFATADEGAGFQAFILLSAVKPEAEILTIATAPNSRRSGHSKRLLETGVFHLLQRGVETLFLEVAVGNAAARCFYQANGFVQTGKRPNYYQLADGSREDALIMSRALGGL